MKLVCGVLPQVWTSDGKKHLGTSGSQGPGGTAPPLRRTYLTAGSWDGRFHPPDSEDASGLGPLQLQTGRTYRLKLELHPVLAAADRMAGREVTVDPLVYELDTKLQLVDESEEPPSNPGPSDSSESSKSGTTTKTTSKTSTKATTKTTTKATTKSRKSGSSSSSSSSASSSSRSKSKGSKRSRGRSRSSSDASAGRTQTMGINPQPYVSLPL